MNKDLTNGKEKKMPIKNVTGSDKYAKKQKSHGTTKTLKGWSR